jgi:hypothetical protein
MKTIRYVGPHAAVTGVYGRVTRGGTVDVEESLAKSLTSTGHWEYTDSEPAEVAPQDMNPVYMREEPTADETSESPTTDDSTTEADFPSVDSDDWADD